MKLSFFILTLLLCAGLSVQAQNGSYLKFDKLVHDFGELTQGDKAEVDFTFTNTGDAPLLLSSVKSSCGCTIPTWSKDPILPGQKGSIKVKYDSNRIGQINKQITVESNATNGVVYLKIAGNISKKPDEVMPFSNFDNNGVPIAQ